MPLPAPVTTRTLLAIFMSSPAVASHPLEPARAVGRRFLGPLRNPVLAAARDPTVDDLEERQGKPRPDGRVRDPDLRHGPVALGDDPEHLDGPAFGVAPVELDEVRATADPDL